MNILEIFKTPTLRKKILFTLLVIFIFRLLAHIPVPGVDVSAVREFLKGSVLFGFFDLFSGGGLQNFSIVTLGVGPYINASIIVQLLTIMIPQLEELSKEGETGREQINTYTRYITFPLALLQSYGVYFFLSSQQVVQPLPTLKLIILILTLTCGTLFLMWVGELVTEYGVGNGISLLIFVGIISRLPSSFVQFVSTINSDNFFNITLFAGISLLVIAGVVLVNEGTRNISLEYGRRSSGPQRVSSYLPVKINQAGVIPIIFAIAVVLIPSSVAGPLQTSSIVVLQKIGFFISSNFTPSTVLYNILYFLLVVGFTYFYTSIQFPPEKISEDIKKRGGFVPGIRPGKSTTQYLRGVMNRITLVGAVFLGLVAILPFLVQTGVGVTSVTIGGTGLLIVVSVVLETIRKMESLMVTKNYEGFLS